MLRLTAPILLLLLIIACPADVRAATTKKKAASARSDVPRAVPVAPTRADATGKPNILFIVVDDLNDWVGWLGGHPQARTPNMDRLAKSGMRFTNAHTAYALCNPSRTALLSGMAPASSGVFGNEQDWRRSVQIAGKPMLPDYFKLMGYATAAGGKIYHANHGGPDALLAGWHGGRRGFERDESWASRFPFAGAQLAEAPVHTGRNLNGLDIWHWDWGPIHFQEAETEDGQLAAWAADYLSKYDSKQPFFLAVGIYKPHSPWYAPQAFFDERPLDHVQLPDVKTDDLDDVPAFAKDHMGKPDSYHALIARHHLWPDAVRAYLACITFADAQLGKVLDALEHSRCASNTIVCLTSDHGWYLGEKQMWHKGKLWERATHVPLSIVAPGVTQAGSVSDQPVSLLDLYPTLCDLTALEKPSHLDGESLLPVLKDPATKRTRPAVTTMGGEARASYAARSDQWRYIRYADGSEELYDHKTDANEWTNVAGKPEHAALKQLLAQSFPKEWHSAHRTLEQMGPVDSADGTHVYRLQPGDLLAAGQAPVLAEKGFAIDAFFDYNPDVDQNSTLLAQGGEQSAWVLHLIAGHPTMTFVVKGQRTAISLEALKPGRTLLRVLAPGNGTVSMAVPGQGEIIDQTPYPVGFPAQPDGPLRACESFAPLKLKEFPNSTPFDGAVYRLDLTVLP